MNSFVFAFKDIDKTKLNVVGGKGANLGELTRIEGIHVPDGFCISTEAFKRIINETSSINELLDQLSLLKVEDHHKIDELSREIRTAIEEIAIPQDITEEITNFLSRVGEKNAHAVRSSATAEDLPTASFCRPAGYLFEHHWKGYNTKVYQQVLGIIVYREGNYLQNSKWV
jgi:pyruvate,water dikinase